MIDSIGKKEESTSKSFFLSNANTLLFFSNFNVVKARINKQTRRIVLFRFD